MRITNKKIGIILMLVTIELIGIVIYMWPKSEALDDVKLNDVNNELFAIMLEQADGTYKESDDNKWPTDNYVYNETKSGCIDINGNDLKGVLSFDSVNNIATVDTGSTSYCYLYFSFPKWCEIGETASECLLRNPTSGLNLEIEANLYRYQGNNADEINNYVCFGTDNTQECVDSTGLFLYRIIGIAPTGHIKLIKKEALPTSMQWWNDYKTDIKWPDSLIYIALNGQEYLLNDIYFGDIWENKISLMSWNYGDTINSGSYNGEIIYEIENSWVNKIDAKIGLMYIHDYFFSYDHGGYPEFYERAKTSWIHLSSNDINAPNNHEWLISRYGINSSGNTIAWDIFESGKINPDVITDKFAIRPVFYLEPDIKIIDGIGTIDDPFIIK